MAIESDHESKSVASVSQGDTAEERIRYKYNAWLQVKLDNNIKPLGFVP